MISETVTELKAEKLTTFSSTSRYWGGGEHCVLHRTSSTFDVKKAEKSSSLVWEMSGYFLYHDPEWHRSSAKDAMG